MNLLHIIKFY